MELAALAWDSGFLAVGLFRPIPLKKELEASTLIRETLKFLAWRVAKEHVCFTA